jgi:hypothetical protein
MPPPPGGSVRPDNAAALEDALRSLIPEDKRYCLDAIVLDVTPPAEARRTETKRAKSYQKK